VQDQGIKEELDRVRAEAEDAKAREEELREQLKLSVQLDDQIKEELDRMRAAAEEAKAREEELQARVDEAEGTREREKEALLEHLDKENLRAAVRRFYFVLPLMVARNS